MEQTLGWWDDHPIDPATHCIILNIVGFLHYGRFFAILSKKSFQVKASTRLLWHKLILRTHRIIFQKTSTILQKKVKSEYLGFYVELKVRQIQNDFFKPMFLPKNERTNSSLLLVDLFSFIFWKKVRTPKRHFEISWPLMNSSWKMQCSTK